MSVNPATISLAVTAASAVSSMMAGNSQADAGQSAAWANYYAQKQQLAVQSKQISDQASAQMSNRATMAAIDQARIQNVAANGGVAGLSVAHLVGDANFQESRDMDAITQNSNNQQLQNYAEDQGAYAQATSRSNIANSQRPTFLGTGLQIAGAVGTAGQKLGWWGTGAPANGN